MAQFRIKTTKNEVLCPNEMEKQDKKLLFDKCEKENVRLFCNCNGVCEYKVRNGSWAIYPCSQGKQADHEDWCPKSKVYLDKRDYNAGFLIDDETGEVLVHLSEPLMHRKQNDDEPNENVPRNYDGGGRRYPHHQQGEITISAMIKKMNMLTFKHVAFYKGNNEIVYPKTNIMIKKMFWAGKRTRIGTKKKSIADLERLKDGLEFVYKELAEIDDYNGMFGTSYDTSSDKFQNYYKDLSLRMKNREIDILIVVNMFLTGFDATTLNTLWVDKNLKYHGLLQAFSRTNRILNSVKTFGNVVCFCNLENETNDAIALFGDREAGSIVLLKNFDSYYYGYDEDGKHYDGYIELIDRLNAEYPLGMSMEGEKAEKEFISLYGAILRMKNILSSFDNFAGNEILSDRDFQDYQSEYIDLYQKYKPQKDEKKENIHEDIVFEIELVKQVEINIDYILMLVKEYQQDGNQNKEIVVTIEKAVNSSMNLRSKKELIRNFLAKVNAQTEVDGDWKKFVDEQREQDLVVIIDEEKLKADETHKFVDNSFRDGVLKTTGTDIDDILPAVSRFGGGNRVEKKKRVIDRLMAYFEKYLELVGTRQD